MKIGYLLRKHIETNHYSQNCLAFHLGISQNAYSKLENDKTSPTLERLSQIADFYDMSVVQLLSEGQKEDSVVVIQRLKNYIGKLREQLGNPPPPAFYSRIGMKLKGAN